MIVGIFGCCRKGELIKMDIKDIKDEKDYVEVKVPNTKTKTERVFVITKGNFENLNLLQIFRNYVNLRPEITNHSRFFISMRNGKCTKQPIGVNTMSDYPKKIAAFLKLPDPNGYKGHCYRRTSASLLADSGVGISIIQRHGGWKSATVAEGYVETSVQNKINIAGKIVGDKTTQENIVMSLDNSEKSKNSTLCIPSTSNGTSSDSNYCIPSSSKGTSSNNCIPSNLNNSSANNSKCIPSTSSVMNSQVSITNFSQDTVILNPVKNDKISDSRNNREQFHFSSNSNCTFNFYVNSKK